MRPVDRFIGIAELSELTDLHKSTIYRRFTGENGFPALVRITPNRTGLLESVFVAWQASRLSIKEQPTPTTQPAQASRSKKLVRLP